MARLRLIRNSLLVVLATSLLTVAAGLMALKLSGNQLLSVQTASMIPTFRPGDGLLVKTSSANPVKIGQVITYHSPRDPNVLISHRLVKVNPKTGWLTTKGDALKTADPSFPPNLVIGRAVLLLPGFGRLEDSLRHPLGLALAVYLPALSIIIIEVLSLASSYARPIYSVRL